MSQQGRELQHADRVWASAPLSGLSLLALLLSPASAPFACAPLMLSLQGRLFFFPETETLNFFVKLRFNKLFFFNGLELEFASEFPMLYFWCALFPFWGEVLAPHTFIRSWSEWFCVYSEFMFNTHHRPLTNPRKLGKAFSAGVDLAACYIKLLGLSCAPVCAGISLSGLQCFSSAVPKLACSNTVSSEP